MAVFESCFLKIGIAGVEQCLCPIHRHALKRAGGGRVGSTPQPTLQTLGKFIFPHTL